MKTFVLLFLSCLLCSCNKLSPEEAERSWTTLSQTSSCLVGAQDAIGDIGEGSCLGFRKWQKYLKKAPATEVDRLTSILGSTSPTNIHVCPFGNATEGELAVYILQHLTGRLWMDYNGKNSNLHKIILKLKTPPATGSWKETDADHYVLQGVLRDESYRKELQRYFTK